MELFQGADTLKDNILESQIFFVFTVDLTFRQTVVMI
jgi:hypothetical protein